MSIRFYGVGAYTVADAARLTGIPAASLRRWLWKSPLWRPQSPVDGDFYSLGFADLMEVRFVDAFRKHGVSLQNIRRSLDSAREFFGVKYPFSSLVFKTDGRRIFADDGDARSRRLLIALPDGQHLYRGLKWDTAGAVESWRPRGEESRIVLDPRRCFGEPIVDKEGVPTEVLADAYVAEESAEAVAEWYEVDIASVEEAVEFELSLAAWHRNRCRFNSLELSSAQPRTRNRTSGQLRSPYRDESPVCGNRMSSGGGF